MEKTDQNTHPHTLPPKPPHNSSHMPKEILHFAALTLIVGGLVLIFGYHCPFYRLFHVRCPGCGMTRALLALLQGDLAMSLQWHALLVPSLFVLVFYCYLWLKKPDKLNRWGNPVIYGWIILMLVYWIWRLIFVFPVSNLL